MQERARLVCCHFAQCVFVLQGQASSNRAGGLEEDMQQYKPAECECKVLESEECFVSKEPCA